jgi:uncharacterized protein with NRDE domain
MCLLVVAHQVSSEVALFVAANRDERYARPATAVTVLRASSPRIVGGRDELAGGTWLAVNELGVVAALTNAPSRTGRDPDKRSRGELPLMLANHQHAADAIEDLVAKVDPNEYNPCWMLVGDRDALFYLEISPGIDPPRVTELQPGLHILENKPLGAPSTKVDRVRALWSATSAATGIPPTAEVAALLGDTHPTSGGDEEVPAQKDDELIRERRRAHSAICIHTDTYGTRSSAIVSVPREQGKSPEMLVADGAPDTVPFTDESWRFRAPPQGGS